MKHVTEIDKEELMNIEYPSNNAKKWLHGKKQK